MNRLDKQVAAHRIGRPAVYPPGRRRVAPSIVIWLIAILVAGSAVIAAILWLMSSSYSPFAAKVEIPPSRAVDKERFLGNFELWGVLSDFRVEAAAPGGVRRGERGGVAPGNWKFTVICKIPGAETRRFRANTARWFVEVFADGQLLSVLEFPLNTKLDPDDPSAPTFLEGEHSLWGFKPDQRLQFFTYLAQPNAYNSRIPVSGILKEGGRRTPEEPVVYYCTGKQWLMTRLSNPRLSLQEIGSSAEDRLQIDFERMDDDFLLDFNPESNRRGDFFLYVEDKYGARKRYILGALVTDKKCVLPLTSANRSRIESEKHTFKRTPLRVWIGRQKPRAATSHKSSMLQPIDFFSNVLDVTKADVTPDSDDED